MGKSISQAEKMTQARLMLRGLTNNAEQLARRGITPEFIARFQVV
jgi:hypothetical protein